MGLSVPLDSIVSMLSVASARHSMASRKHSEADCIFNLIFCVNFAFLSMPIFFAVLPPPPAKVMLFSNVLAGISSCFLLLQVRKIAGSIQVILVLSDGGQ